MSVYHSHHPHDKDPDAIINPDTDTVMGILIKFNKYHQLPIIWAESPLPHIQEALMLYYNSGVNKAIDKMITSSSMPEPHQPMENDL